VVSRCYLLTCPIVPKTVMDINKVEVEDNFAGTCCFHLQGIISLKDGITQCCNPKDNTLHFQSCESHKFLLAYMVFLLHSYAISQKSQTLKTIFKIIFFFGLAMR
jgi:hypothetical protein